MKAGELVHRPSFIACCDIFMGPGSAGDLDDGKVGVDHLLQFFDPYQRCMDPVALIGGKLVGVEVRSQK